MGRDLLYRPPPGYILPDEEEEGEGGKKVGAKDKTAGTKPQPLSAKVSRASEVGETVAKAPKATPAHLNAYFNKDVNGLRQVNQATSQMKALRGGEGAADLRKIVLPASELRQAPVPEELDRAGRLMGLAGGLAGDGASSKQPEFEDYLGRMAAWAQDKRRSVADIEALKAHFERMVAARKAALQRLRKSRGQHGAGENIDLAPNHGNTTWLQAEAAGGGAVEESEDLAGDARALVRATKEQAAPMHARVRKVLGIKGGVKKE